MKSVFVLLLANLPRNSRAGKWYNMTNREMKDFIALFLLTAIIQKPEINHYWSTDPLLKSSIFNETMARNRYKTITEFLHLNDYSNCNGGNGVFTIIEFLHLNDNSNCNGGNGVFSSWISNHGDPGKESFNR